MGALLQVLLCVSVCGQCVIGKRTVLVVGAGPSGIASATRLLEKGVDVLVLEAGPRIGGRVNSVHFGDAYIDMGAEWCHGKEGNIVYNMVKEYNILGAQEINTVFLSSDQRYIDSDFSDQLHEIFENIYSWSGNRDIEEGISTGQYFIKTYNKTVRERYENDKSKLDYALMALESFEHDILSTEGAFSWFESSAKTDYLETPGYLYLDWNGYGYQTILDVMMKKYPIVDPKFEIDSKIVLNQEVKKISWGDIGVNVTCSNGKKYHAEHVIFSPSLGVLKHYHEDIFHPSLPHHKIEAIKELGMGAVVKVIMHFPIRWWPTTNFTGYAFVWEYTIKEMLIVEYPHGPSKNGRSWLLDIYSIFPVMNNPNVLSVWFTGDLVPEIEKMSHHVLIDGIMYVLDRFLGHLYKPTKPNRIIRSNWYANPHFLGTYSYQTTSSRKLQPSPNLILAKPLFDNNNVPRVMFAGEATHPNYYSTVHGAIESGYREANRLQQYLNINNTHENN